tara:strand:+ start:1586 stop:1753 length:168 start_codon:yes stop_codon:yes gene_type:complete
LIFFRVSKLAQHAGAIVVNDNICSAPVSKKLPKFGADDGMYSAAKYIYGQGWVLD